MPTVSSASNLKLRSKLSKTANVRVTISNGAFVIRNPSLSRANQHSLPLLGHSEYNHRLDDDGNCVPIPGQELLASEDTCRNGESSWWERTAYRKIPYSTCDGGTRLDRGRQHNCPGLQGHSAMFWLMVIVIPFLFAGLVGWWYYRRSGMARG